MTASLNRLRWLCRRGMLELDAWLAPFLETHYPEASAELQSAFARLLDQDDMTLFDWFTGEKKPPGEFQTVVEAIKSTRYPRP